MKICEYDSNTKQLSSLKTDGSATSITDINGVVGENGTQSNAQTMMNYVSGGVKTLVGNDSGKSVRNIASEETITIKDIFGPSESSPSTSAYVANEDYLIYEGKLRKVIADIAVGDTLVEGTNIEQTTMMKELKSAGGSSGGGSSVGGGTTIVQIPKVDGVSFIYDGSAQGPTITGLDTSKVNITGDTTATEAGSHEFTISLKDTSSMVWSDNTIAPKTYHYGIGTTGIFGATWTYNNSNTDESSYKAWTRTDDAENFTDPIPAVNNGNGSSPFDTIYPWSGMQIVEDPIAGTLVSIPKFYYKWTVSSNTYKLQISATPQDGFSTSFAHADRRDGQGERDMVYIGRYYCSNLNYKSLTKNTLSFSKTITENRNGIRTLGNEFWQYDYDMAWTIMFLYIVEYATWSLKKIGVNDYIEASGATDSMIYHTGSNNHHIQYRYIEDFFSNCVYTFCDGWIGIASQGSSSSVYYKYYYHNSTPINQYVKGTKSTNSELHDSDYMSTSHYSTQNIAKYVICSNGLVPYTEYTAPNTSSLPNYKVVGYFSTQIPTSTSSYNTENYILMMYNPLDFRINDKESTYGRNLTSRLQKLPNNS